MIRRGTFAAATAIVVVVLMVGVTGFPVFARARSDIVEHADAVIVLGGEHDGREEYGLQLARRVGARALVLSNPYPADDVVMRKMCNLRTEIEIICRTPVPGTTRGEAILMRTLSDERNWAHIVGVTWRYHLVRTRLVFRQCYSNIAGDAAFQAVPGHDHTPLVLWEYIFIYQYLALMKAVIQGPCESNISAPRAGDDLEGQTRRAWNREMSRALGRTKSCRAVRLSDVRRRATCDKRW